MKLSQKLLKDDPYHLTPPQDSSGTSMSSMTPGKDLEERWKLDKVSDVKDYPHHLSWDQSSLVISISPLTQGRDLEDRLSLLMGLSKTFIEASKMLICRGRRVDSFQASDWPAVTFPVISLVAAVNSPTPTYLFDLFSECSAGFSGTFWSEKSLPF